jgi:endonuclease-8
MPEGDTIHRTAATLGALLTGRRLTRLEAPRLPGPMRPPGTAVVDVAALGKHLLVTFDDDWVLHTHMRMTGSWHTYHVGDRWRRGPSRMRALLADPEVQAVCFDAPVVELLDPPARDRHPALRALGPDLVVRDDGVELGLERMAALGAGHRPVVEVLLDQRITAGIGNVYANEVAFLAGVHPLTDLASVDQERRATMLADATRLLRANLTTRSRTTVPRTDGGLWVYDRGGRPCRRCGTTILGRKVGDGARPTYWCPTCQVRPRRS